jgi:hypothetical protein
MPFMRGVGAGDAQGVEDDLADHLAPCRVESNLFNMPCPRMVQSRKGKT